MQLPLLLAATLLAFDYPHPPADPQRSGWPLTAEERAYVVDKPEHDRRPGRESNKHLPHLWPCVPTAGHWGGASWLETHAKLVAYVRSNPGPVDVLLVGDSITQQWGSPLDTGAFNEAWNFHFQKYKSVNIGIGGDKTQNVLWRLDHGAVDGIEPRVILLMIGNNNMFFAPETGVVAAAKGIKTCVENLRKKFPQASLIVAKILPCHAPENRFYENIRLTNVEIDKLALGSDAKVRVLDLGKDFVDEEGRLKKTLFKPDNIHLSLEGYKVYAARLKPLLEGALGEM